MNLEFDVELIPSDALGVAYAISRTPVSCELERRRAQNDADPNGVASALLRQYIALAEMHVARCRSALRLLEGTSSAGPRGSEDLRVFGNTLASVFRAIDAAISVSAAQSSEAREQSLRVRKEVARDQLSASFRAYTEDLYERWTEYEAANQDAVPRLRAAKSRLAGEA